jgi:DNA-binding response OmpR family regulator
MASEVKGLNVVLVEDHDVLRQLIAQTLEAVGHRVTALSCAEELEDVAGGQPADVFLIDLNLPGEDGLSLTERVRAAYPLAGVVLVTARSGLDDRLEGYARGADLYLSKPVEVSELCAAVAAMGRRRERVDSIMRDHKASQLTLNERQMRIERHNQAPVSLTASETSILVAFTRAPGQRLAHWQIAETLGLDPATYAKASLEVRIVRLRKKLVDAGADARCIESVRNHGYQLCVGVRIA